MRLEWLWSLGDREVGFFFGVIRQDGLFCSNG